MQKITYWKIAYFLAPVITTLLVEIFFWRWLQSSYDAAPWQEIVFIYFLFTLFFSLPSSLCPFVFLDVIIPDESILRDYYPYILSVFFVIFGYFQWFYLLSKWIGWRNSPS